MKEQLILVGIVAALVIINLPIVVGLSEWWRNKLAVRKRAREQEQYDSGYEWAAFELLKAAASGVPWEGAETVEGHTGTAWCSGEETPFDKGADQALYDWREMNRNSLTDLIVRQGLAIGFQPIDDRPAFELVREYYPGSESTPPNSHCVWNEHNATPGWCETNQHLRLRIAATLKYKLTKQVTDSA